MGGVVSETGHVVRSVMADFGQTDFGQTDFDLCLCVFVCVVCVCVLVSRFPCGGFKVLVWSCSVPPEPPFPGTALPGTAQPGTALPLDRPSPRPPFSPRPPKISLFFFPSPAAKFVLFFPLWVSSR